MPAHVIQMETFTVDDSHLCWSHGVGAVRVAKEPRKATRGGKGTAWEGECLEAQAKFTFCFGEGAAELLPFLCPT